MNSWFLWDKEGYLPSVILGADVAISHFVVFLHTSPRVKCSERRIDLFILTLLIL